MSHQKRILLICLITSSLGFFSLAWLDDASATSAMSRAQFCSERGKPGYFNQLAYDSKNQMAFPNQGGLLQSGVCWWHALFQRAALYMTVYRPELPRPKYAQVQTLVHQIAVGKQIVEIPGYSNFYDFSREWEPVIQAKLEEWQLVDGFLKFAWIEGLKGKSVVPPTELEKEIDLIYKKTSQDHDIQWIMLQMPGIPSHGILSLEAVRYPGGAQIEVVDNNFVGRIKVLHYQQGAATLQSMYYGKVASYLGRTQDLIHFKEAAQVYCSNGPVLMSAKIELDNGIE